LADSRPIGVFDSGVGGFTVLRALHDLFPLESTVYLGDLARCPYGTRPQSEVRRFALQVGDILANEGVKLLVVACNTATAAAYEHLRDRYPFPVVGVIGPGAREAARLTRKRRVAVVATTGTVNSGAYRSALLAECPDMFVVERPASWLVPLLERGPIGRASVAAELSPLMLSLRGLDVDVLILGCTHFPLARDLFEQEAGPGTVILDSATTTANEVGRLLRESAMQSEGPAAHRFLVTGPAEAFAERAQTMFHASPVIETLDGLLTLTP